MNCRVLVRGVEQAVLNEVVAAARAEAYIPTKKNGLVRDLFAKLGFAKVPEQADGTAGWELDVATYNQPDVPILVNPSTEVRGVPTCFPPNLRT